MFRVGANRIRPMGSNSVLSEEDVGVQLDSTQLLFANKGGHKVRTLL